MKKNFNYLGFYGYPLVKVKYVLLSIGKKKNSKTSFLLPLPLPHLSGSTTFLYGFPYVLDKRDLIQINCIEINDFYYYYIIYYINDNHLPIVTGHNMYILNLM